MGNSHTASIQHLTLLCIDLNPYLLPQHSIQYTRTLPSTRRGETGQILLFCLSFSCLVNTPNASHSPQQRKATLLGVSPAADPGWFFSLKVSLWLSLNVQSEIFLKAKWSMKLPGYKLFTHASLLLASAHTGNDYKSLLFWIKLLH